MATRIVVLQRGEGHDAATWPAAMAAALDGSACGPWSLDILEPDDALRGAAGLRQHGARYDGVLWTTDAGPDDGAAPPWWGVVAGTARLAAAFVTVPHHGWGPLHAAPGVVQISFLAPAEGLTPESFRSRYRAHVSMARTHMPAVVRYVQHDVHAAYGEDAAEFVAISELRFASAADVRERYWATPQSAGEFTAQEDWLDRGRAMSVFGTDHHTGAG